jgi:hypothetical protein
MITVVISAMALSSLSDDLPNHISHALTSERTEVSIDVSTETNGFLDVLIERLKDKQVPGLIGEIEEIQNQVCPNDYVLNLSYINKRMFAYVLNGMRDEFNFEVVFQNGYLPEVQCR